MVRLHLEIHELALHRHQCEALEGHVREAPECEWRLRLLGDEQVLNADTEGTILVVARLVAHDHACLHAGRDVVPTVT